MTSPHRTQALFTVADKHSRPEKGDDELGECQESISDNACSTVQIPSVTQHAPRAQWFRRIDQTLNGQETLASRGLGFRKP